MVLHHLQQDFDRLLAVIALVVGLVEIIGLVDEQHAAHGFLQHFAGFGRGVADILADEIVARHRHQMTFAHIAEAMQQPAILSATVVLPTPGLPVKLMCRVGVSCANPQFLPRAIHQQQRGGLADALFDRREADQFAVKFFEDFRDARGVGNPRRDLRGLAAVQGRFSTIAALLVHGLALNAPRSALHARYGHCPRCASSGTSARPSGAGR